MANYFPSFLRADEQSRAGRMFSAGDVRVTVTEPESGDHITVRFKATKDNRPSDNGQRPMPDEDRNWVRVPLKDATHVYIEVPNSSGEFPDKIGTFYPRTGRFFEDRNADSQRVNAATLAAHWLNGSEPELPLGYRFQEESYCGKCGRTLTDPESIDRGIGPECNRRPTDSHHQQKQRQLKMPIDNDEQLAVDSIIAELTELSDAAQVKVLHELKMWHSV